MSDPWTGAGFDAPPAIANGRVYRAVRIAAAPRTTCTGRRTAPGRRRSATSCGSRQVGPGVRAPAVANGLVYVSAGDGTVQAYDADGVTNCSATTRVCSALWDTNIGSAAGPVEVAGGQVYVGAVDGTVHVYGLSPSRSPRGVSGTSTAVQPTTGPFDRAKPPRSTLVSENRRARLRSHRWNGNTAWNSSAGPNARRRRESAEVLGPLGQEGLEAMSMVPWGYGHEGDFIVLFKRPIVDRA